MRDYVSPPSTLTVATVNNTYAGTEKALKRIALWIRIGTLPFTRTTTAVIIPLAITGLARRIIATDKINEQSKQQGSGNDLFHDVFLG